MRAARFLFSGMMGLLAGQATAQTASPWRDAPFALPAVPMSASLLHVVAVGDVLLHTPLHQQMLAQPEGARSLWPAVAPWIQGADLAYANLEGPVAPGVRAGGVAMSDPGDVVDGRVYASFPAFNYHARLAQDLADSGFDVVSTANNHAMDRGSLGVDRTLDALDAAHLAHTGTRRTTTPNADWAVVTETHGWRVAWLACAYSTNGIPDPHHQVLGCFADRAEVLATVTRLVTDPTIDAVIVTPHVGVEYMDQPTAQVVALDRDLVDAGATAVLGAHPHVTEPWTTHTAPDGHVGVIVYSLGNFVSGQFQRVATRASVMVGLDLAKGPTGHAQVVGAHYLPLEMGRQNHLYEVRPITADTGTPAIYERLTQMFDQALTDDGSGKRLSPN